LLLRPGVFKINRCPSKEVPSGPTGSANSTAPASSFHPFVVGGNAGGGSHGFSVVGSPMDSSGGGQGGGGGSGGSGNPGNPTLSFGTLNNVPGPNNVVGGDMLVNVVAPGTVATFATVTWEVTGAEQSQNYTNQTGSMTQLTNPYAGVVGGHSPALKFAWDATAVTHTIKVTVLYAAPFSGTGTATTSVAVVAPTVNSLVMDSYPLAWFNPLPNSSFPGFTLQGGPGNGFPAGAGLSPGASVTLPATATTPGRYGFIQMASLSYVVTNPATGNHTLTSNGFVLDNDPNFKNANDFGWPAFGGWASLTVNPGATVSNTPFTGTQAQPVIPLDVPRLGALTAIDVNGANDPPNEANLTFQISDWLVYQSGGGCWVGIGKTNTLLANGDEKLAGNPLTWSPNGALTPAPPGVVIGGGGVAPTFVAWTDYMTHNDFNPQYPNSPYFK